MSIAREVIGEVVREEAAEARTLIPVDNLNLSWIYAHFPMAWEFKDGRWLPELSQISFRRGLNGQPQDGDTSAPKQHVVSKGGTLIEPQNARLGVYKNYLRRFPAFNSQSKQRGTYYASMFEKPTVIGGRFAKWTLDTKGYDEFRAYLVKRGIIEEIDSTVIEAKLDEKRGLVDHLKNLPATQLRKERIATLEDLIEKMEKSLETASAPEGEETTLEGEVVAVGGDEADELDALLDGRASEEGTPPAAPRRKPGSRN